MLLQTIVTGTAIQIVVPFLTIEVVVSIATKEDVVASLAIQLVATGPTVKAVVTSSAVQVVVTVKSSDRIAADGALQTFRSCGTDNRLPDRSRTIRRPRRVKVACGKAGRREAFEGHDGTITVIAAIQIDLENRVPQTIVDDAQETCTERIRGPIPTTQVLRKEIIEPDDIFGQIEIRHRNPVVRLDIGIAINLENVSARPQGHARGLSIPCGIAAICIDHHAVIARACIHQVIGAIADIVDLVIPVTAQKRL